MRYNLRKVLLGLAGSVALVTAALALTVPPTFGPRSFQTQQVHYERHVVTVTSTGCSADAGQLGQSSNFVAGSCNVKVGALPYNAFVARGYVQVTTACNAATTCTFSLGTASGGAQLVSAQSVIAALAGTPLTIVAANLGTAATGSNIAQTGTDGGFDLWVNVAQTGAAATQGSFQFIIEYFAPNDGGCTMVPMGATAPAC